MSTIIEKILAAHSGRETVKPGEYVWATIDESKASRVEYENLRKLGIKNLFDPERIWVIDDHKAPPPDVETAEHVAETRRLVKEYGITHWLEYGRHGVLHQRFPETGFCVPGDLIAMEDSHSTTYGAFNAAGCPINVEQLYVLIKGKLWFRVPETVKFNLTGHLPEMTVGKDVILKIASTYGTDVAVYKAVEYLGPLAREMSLASRWTMSNMGIEIGAKCAIFECDEKTTEFIRGRTNRKPLPTFADKDAKYERVIDVDVTDLEPMVALPHDPGNSVSVASIESKEVRINQGFIGSCTNGRFEDLKMAADILNGKKVHPDVRLIISPSSVEVWKDALRAGLLGTFIDANALVCHPTCGPCMGSHMGILAAGERCISTTNRNFQGRMGSPQSEVYLANAATVACSTIEGKITDPRGYA